MFCNGINHLSSLSLTSLLFHTSGPCERRLHKVKIARSNVYPFLLRLHAYHITNVQQMIARSKARNDRNKKRSGSRRRSDDDDDDDDEDQEMEVATRHEELVYWYTGFEDPNCIAVVELVATVMDNENGIQVCVRVCVCMCVYEVCVYVCLHVCISPLSKRTPHYLYVTG